MLLDPQAISMMPPELEHSNPIMDNSATVVAIQDLMEKTSLENEEQTVEEAVFVPKGSLVLMCSDGLIGTTEQNQE